MTGAGIFPDLSDELPGLLIYGVLLWLRKIKINFKYQGYAINSTEKGVKTKGYAVLGAT